MYYAIENAQLVETENPDFTQPCVGMFSYEDFNADGVPIGDFPEMVKEQTNNRHMYIHVGDSFFSGKVLIKANDGVVHDGHAVYFYFSKQLVLFLENMEDSPHEMTSIFHHLPRTNITLDDIILQFFSALVINDLANLEKLENHLTEVEENVLFDKEKHFNTIMSDARHILLRLHHFYEEFEDLVEVLISNDNSVLTQRVENSLNRFLKRVNRLQDSTRILRDYTATIQQIYQSQVEIRQNSISRILTVVTTIFFRFHLLPVGMA